MKLSNKYIAIVSLVFVSTVLQAQTLQLQRDEWSGPRSGERMLQNPVLRQVMGQMAADPKSRLLIRYPGGEDGIIWVAELEAWLVALGLDSTRIQTRPGSPSADIIELEVISEKRSN